MTHEPGVAVGNEQVPFARSNRDGNAGHERAGMYARGIDNHPGFEAFPISQHYLLGLDADRPRAKNRGPGPGDQLHGRAGGIDYAILIHQ